MTPSAHVFTLRLLCIYIYSVRGKNEGTLQLCVCVDGDGGAVPGGALRVNLTVTALLQC